MTSEQTQKADQLIRFDRSLLANIDWVIVAAVLAIVSMGLINLYSSTYHMPHGGPGLFVRQIAFFAVGCLMAAAMVSFDYRQLMVWNYPIYGIVMGLLVWVLLFGRTIANTKRWIDLGFFNLQPSEPAKLAMVIVLASYYFRKDTGAGFTIKQLIVPFALTTLPFVLIHKQPDLGSAMMMFVIFGSLTLFVKLRWTALLGIFGSAMAIIPLAWNFFLKPYQKQRIETFLNPEGDPLKTGYHIMQSKIAVGSGQKFGKGLLEGTQAHLDFLPERHTDFAFSVWGEEWGFIGSIFFLVCYFFFVLWGFNIAISARDKFGVLLAFGIISLIFWQAVINLAMVMGLLPVVGVPLPLFSYGGSSLFTTMVGIGILMNIRMRRFIKHPQQTQ